MNPSSCDSADCSSLIVSHKRPYKPKPGYTIKLTDNTSVEWRIYEVDEDDLNKEISISADENLNDNACRMFVLEEPGDGKFCVYPEDGHSELRNKIMIDRCDRYEANQIWCFDKKGRIHAFDNDGLCWQATCMDEDCKLKLKSCSGSKKQKWIHLAFREEWTEGSPFSEPICLKEESGLVSGLCLKLVGSPRRNGSLRLGQSNLQWLQRSSLVEN